MICPKCHANVPEGMNFCDVCGAQLSPQPQFCPVCKAEVSKDMKFCGSCGARIADFATAPAAAPRPIAKPVVKRVALTPPPGTPATQQRPVAHAAPMPVKAQPQAAAPQVKTQAHVAAAPVITVPEEEPMVFSAPSEEIPVQAPVYVQPQIVPQIAEDTAPAQNDEYADWMEYIPTQPEQQAAPQEIRREVPVQQPIRSIYQSNAYRRPMPATLQSIAIPAPTGNAIAQAKAQQARQLIKKVLSPAITVFQIYALHFSHRSPRV